MVTTTISSASSTKIGRTCFVAKWRLFHSASNRKTFRHSKRPNSANYQGAVWIASQTSRSLAPRKLSWLRA